MTVTALLWSNFLSSLRWELRRLCSIEGSAILRLNSGVIDLIKSRQTKEGLLVPSSMLKGLAGLVSVQQQGNVLLIESERRRTARRSAARVMHTHVLSKGITDEEFDRWPVGRLIQTA